MHVVFVNCPSPFLVSDKGAPALGVLHLAAECASRGMVANHLDLTGDRAVADYFANRQYQGVDWFHADLQWMLEEMAESSGEDVSLFAITATSAQYQSAVDLKNIIKRVRPRMPVAIGGSHVSTLPNMAIDDGFDLVAIGEADIDFPAHLEQYHVEAGKPFVLTCKAPTDLDRLQVPARGLVDLKSYCGNLGLGEGLTTTVHFSRGCPFACAYCVRSLGDKARVLRVRAPELCLAELDDLKDEYGISRFVATDDIFAIKRSWLEGFCDYLRGRDYHFRVNCRANTLHFDLLPAMRRAGVEIISFGFESGDERVLAAISKNSTEKNETAIKACHDAGIAVKAYLIFGFAEDDEASAEATKRFIETAQPDSAQIAWLIPLPGTPIHRNAILGGWLPDYTALYHNGKDHRGGMSKLPWHTDRTADIYEELVQWVENFYGQPQPEIQCPVADRN